MWFLFIMTLGLAFLVIAWYGSWKDAQMLETYARLMDDYEKACQAYFQDRT